MNDGRVLYTRWEYTDTAALLHAAAVPHEPRRHRPDGVLRQQLLLAQRHVLAAADSRPSDDGRVRRLRPSRRVARGRAGAAGPGPRAATRPTASCSAFPATARRSSRSSSDNLVGDSWPQVRRALSAGRAGDEPRGGQVLPGLRAARRRSRRGTCAWSTCSTTSRRSSTRRLHDADPAAAAAHAAGHPVAASTRARSDATGLPGRRLPGRRACRAIPRGSIKALRVGSHHYRYAGNGDTRASAYEGGWDVKRILGTVPVARGRLGPVPRAGQHADLRAAAGRRGQGPAADAELVHGHAGRDRPRASAATSGRTAARRARHTAGRAGTPVGDRAVVRAGARLQLRPRGAAGARPPLRRLPQRPALPATASGRVATLDLRAKRLHADFDGRLQPGLPGAAALRAPGRLRGGHTTCTCRPSSRPTPACWCRCSRRGTTTSQLDRDEWERLYTWIDFNVPYPANWRESHRPPQRRAGRRCGRSTRSCSPTSTTATRSRCRCRRSPRSSRRRPAAAARPRAAGRASGWPLAGRAGRRRCSKRPGRAETGTRPGRRRDA